VETHIHLDKSCLLGRCNCEQGTLDEAKKQNLILDYKILLGDAARRVPWRGTWRPALVALVFLSCFNSGAVLVEFGTAKDAQMQRQVADLQALADVRDNPCLNPSGAVDPLVMPAETSPALYYRAIDRFGDPSARQPVRDPAAFDQARTNLLRPGCR
jgi:hypothetical protein